MRRRTVILLVAGREIRDRLRSKGFLIGSGVTLVALLAFILVPPLFQDDGPAEFDLGVLGTSPPELEQALTAAAEAQGAWLSVTGVADREAAAAAVADGELDAVIVDGEELLVESNPDQTLRNIVDQALEQAAFLQGLDQLGVEPAEAAGLLQGREPVTVVTPSGTQEEREAGMGIGLFATILLFLTIQINAGTLLTGTIEEKSSRVVEVLLGTLRPWQLLAGKLVGISTLAIGQLVLYVGAVLGANAVVGTFELPAAAAATAIAGIAMFVVGFAFFAALYAVAGSMASSIEDAQASAGPLGFLTAGIYMAVLIGVVPNPNGVLARVLTFLPPSAPFAVPARLASGAVPVWEIAVAVVVTVVGAFVTVRIAGRLYSAAVLAGGKLTWREVWRAEPIT